MKIKSLVLLILSSCYLFGQLPINNPEYQLEVNETFSDFSLYDSLWERKNGTTRSHTDMYTLVNERHLKLDLDNGVLEMRASQIPSTITHLNSKGHRMDFYAAEVKTFNEFGFGYYEISCKMPNGVGYFPAFWMYNSDGQSWPPELDIFEWVHEKNLSDSKLTAGVFWRTDDETDKNLGKMSAATKKSSILKPGEINHPSDLFNKFNKFAIDWTPNYIVYYINNIEVGRITTNVPQEPMAMCISLQINYGDPSQDGPTPYSDPNYTMNNLDEISLKIDHVKYWKRTTPYNDNFLDVHHSTFNSLSGWDVQKNDKIIIGDFTGRSEQDFLMVSKIPTSVHYENSGPDKYKTVRENGYENRGQIIPHDWWDQNYDEYWFSYTSGPLKIGTWNINEDDNFIVGNFDNSNDNEELLCISNTGQFSHLLKFNETNEVWYKTYGNGGNGTLGAWTNSSSSEYYVGDFNSDGVDELLTINMTTKHAIIQKLNTALALDNWEVIWDNQQNSPNAIQNWNINSGDRFVVGDFDGDGFTDDLLSISANGVFVKIQRFETNTWENSTYYSNGANGKIGCWTIQGNEQFLAGDFTNSGKDQLLIVSNNGKMLRVLEYSSEMKSMGYVWGSNLANSDFGFKISLQENKLRTLRINGEADQIFVSNHVDEENNLSYYILTVPKTKEDSEWNEVDKRTDIVSDIIVNSNNRIFYKDLNNDIDGLYKDGNLWKWYSVAGVSNVKGDLVLHPQTEDIYYLTTDNDIDALVKNGSWVHEEVVLRNDVKGSLAFKSNGQLFYIDNTNDVDGLYYSNNQWNWMSVIGRQDFASDLAFSPSNQLYYKDINNDIDKLYYSSGWNWDWATSVNDVVGNIQFNSLGNVFYKNNSNNIVKLSNNNGTYSVNYVTTNGEVVGEFYVHSDGGIYYVDADGDIDALYENSNGWEFFDIIALANVVGEFAIGPYNQLFYKTTTGDIDAIQLPIPNNQRKQIINIENPELLEAILYPNPSNGEFTLLNIDAKQIRVIDLNGRIIKEIQNNNHNVLSFDLSNESNGVYTISIIREQGVQTLKLIISR